MAVQHHADCVGCVRLDPNGCHIRVTHFQKVHMHPPRPRPANHGLDLKVTEIGHYDSFAASVKQIVGAGSGQCESPRLMMGHPELRRIWRAALQLGIRIPSNGVQDPSCCAQSRDDDNGRFTPAELTGERTGRRWVNLNFTRCHAGEEEAFAPRSAPRRKALAFQTIAAPSRQILLSSSTPLDVSRHCVEAGAECRGPSLRMTASMLGIPMWSRFDG